MTTITTDEAARRIPALDIVRGLAVMGILLMNIIAFAMPETAYVDPRAWGGMGATDMTVWTIIQILFEGRMRGLFALLFGASMLLVMERAEAGGASPVATHLRRMIVLALFGAAHLFLVWEGDILLHYALIGLVLWLAWKWSPRRLVMTAVALLALQTLFWGSVMGGALALEAAATQPGASPELVAQYRNLLTEFPRPDSPSIARDLGIYTGGYAEIVSHRVNDRNDLPMELMWVFGAETLGYMLIGMALFRSGFFSSGWSRKSLMRLMLICYAVSLPVLGLLTWWAFASGFSGIVLMGNFIGWSIPFRVLCAVGHLALAMLLIGKASDGRLARRIGAAGRMAFTNYLATSLVMTTIFYGYGLELFGKVGRAESYLFVLGMWVLMLLWSKPWLDRFRYGPFEWLWRSLSRLSLQPMRRDAAA